MRKYPVRRHERLDIVGMRRGRGRPKMYREKSEFDMQLCNFSLLWT